MTRRLLLLVVVGAAIALGFVPIARAGGGVLQPTTEAWYQPNPSCGTPAGCVTTGTLPAAPPAPVPSSPFPAGSMHIGWAGGTEIARSYLAFDFGSLEGALTDAQLDVPLDVAQADGDLQSATAKVQVCLAIGAIAPVEGALDSPPGVDCASQVAMTYVATPAPHLHADLSSLVRDLPSSSGLALLPDATKNAQTDVWQVTFSAHNRIDAAKTPPAALTVTSEDAPSDVPTTDPLADLPQAEPTSGTALAGPPLPPLVQPPAPTDAPPQVSVPTVSQPVAAPRTITVGYAYPVVWLLPLALLVVVPLATRALTKDLSP